MATKRVFIALAVEDEQFHTYLAAQVRLDKSPFEFVDMSVKEPWDEKWKTNCRTRVKGCDGVFALISKNIKNAEGQLWEIQCAYEEGIPVMLMWINNERPALPALLKDKRINTWNWKNLKNFIDNL